MSKSSRRRFITNSSKAVVAGSVLFTTNNPRQKEMKNIFVHHVFFWLKNSGNTDDAKELVAGLKKLATVSTIRQFHIGRPAPTKRDVIDTSYAVSWLALFDTKADQDSYQSDPIHLKFIEECSALWEKVIVYDSVDV